MNDDQILTAEVARLLNLGLERLKSQNSLMSIRSIAAQVSLSPSYLSKVFRGERKLQPASSRKIAHALRLDHHEIHELERLLLKQIQTTQLPDYTADDEAAEPGDETDLADYQTLGKDGYWILEDWYHIPLLNLVTSEHFHASSEWISNRLGITTQQAEDSVRRLVEAGHLQRGEHGKITRTNLKVRFPTDRSHEAVCNFHKAMIGKALSELSHPEPGAFKERQISGVSFAGDPQRLDEAKRILDEAMYRAAEHLAGGTCSEVFQVNLQLFKLTR
ncbi:MAG: TIGR02147 family protein [Proteobacteria bacterium]|nr:MAG: TIGR02147 family protein [Pseudomonadota bacterium]